MESDICIVGAGLCGTVLAEKLSEQTDAKILLIEGGRDYDFEKRAERRQGYLDYQYDPWPGSKDLGIYSAVGGMALHWGAHCARFNKQDFRDWPIGYEDLETYYGEAERRIGVAGPEEAPDRSTPYPMPALPLPYGVGKIREWVTRAGLQAGPEPYARNSVEYNGRPACTRCDTCYVCPTGAKYSPDLTLKRLLKNKKVNLLSRHQIVRLEPGQGGEISSLKFRSLDSGEEGELKARHIVLAGGTIWNSALLLASPGVANSSGLVGRGIGGHPQVRGHFELPEPLYPGQYGRIGLQCDQFTGDTDLRFELRFDVRLPAPEMRNNDGSLLLGDALLQNWQGQLARGLVRLRCFFEVPTNEESKVTVSGDLRAKLDFKWSPALPQLRQRLTEKLDRLSSELQTAGATFLGWDTNDYPHHPCGGCRMGVDPKTSVCDTWGRTHDHPNLWVAGGSLSRSGGCTSSSLTFAALTLRTGEELLRDLNGEASSSKA